MKIKHIKIRRWGRNFCIAVSYCLLVLFIAISCKAQNCKDVPKTFKSYAEAELVIKKTAFTYVDQVSTSKSSWIKEGKYYSCDGKTGFFVLVTKAGRTYLFQDMPINTWRAFKKADSYGGYYNQYIRDKYQLKIEKL